MIEISDKNLPATELLEVTVPREEGRIYLVVPRDAGVYLEITVYYEAEMINLSDLPWN